MNDHRLNESSIRELVLGWYRLLDIHAPLEDVQQCLSRQELEFQLPETTLRSLEEFRTWYEGVLRIFFDEVHDVKTLDVRIDGSRAAVSLMVNWKASRWHPPAANSERLDFDVYQRWTVIADPESGKPVISQYIVDRLEPMRGSPPL